MTLRISKTVCNVAMVCMFTAMLSSCGFLTECLVDSATDALSETISNSSGSKAQKAAKAKQALDNY